MIHGQSGFIRFPSIEKQDVIRFYFAKKLPYHQRIIWIFLLIGFGFFLQLMTLNPFYGLPFIIIGSGLGLVKGYDSRVRLRSFQNDTDWTETDIEKLKEIEVLRKKTRTWDKDALDISNTLGCFVFFLLNLVGVFLCLILGVISGSIAVAITLFLDGFLIVVPFYFTGMRFILKHNNLMIKVDNILKLHAVFEQVKKPGESFKPSMKLARDKKGQTVPVDLKFAVKHADAPKEFYGLQAQVNINMVQGTSYPYFYCVVVAKAGYGLNQYADRITLPDKVICEFQSDKEVDVLIIRQFTSKTSGYHTTIQRSSVILQAALEATRMVLNQ